MTELYLQLFSLYLMHMIQGLLLWIQTWYWFSRKVCKYTVCCGAPVAFKFSIDCHRKWANTQNPLNKGLCWKYHDWGQNIKIWWFYNTSTPNGRSLSFENWFKSDISLISWMSVISLKSGDFIEIDNISCKYTKR